MNKSFTLIELLVVIVIIGILAGVIIVSTSSSINKANLAKAQSFSNTVQNELLLNLVSEWTFDEDSGTTAKDTWGNNDGTVSGGAIYQNKDTGNCVYGGCYEFDGTDDRIEIPGSNLLTSNLTITGEITLSTWVKFSVSGQNFVIIGKGVPSSSLGDRGYVLHKGSSNRIIFETYNTETVDQLATVNTITDSNWHFIVGTWDGTTNTDGKKIYIDGILEVKKTSVISQISTLENWYFRIGESSYDGVPRYLNGLIDDSRLYSTALTATQIKQEYIAGLNSLLAGGNISEEEYNKRINSLALY